MRLIVTDGVFSMDGNVAPLKAIGQLADHYKAMIFIDECHATGFFGATGRCFLGAPLFFFCCPPLCSHMIDGPSPLIVPGVLRNTLVCPTEPISSTRPSEKLWVVRREGTRPARKN